jgi:hypothetical protein
MTRNKTKSTPASAPAAENPRNFYGGGFTTDELALVAAFVSDPTLDDELWLQRVANRRLFQRASETPGQDVPELDVLIKVAEALATGTGRVARLLRDKRALSGEAADGIAGALAQALDELASELGLEL